MIYSVLVFSRRYPSTDDRLFALAFYCTGRSFGLFGLQMTVYLRRRSVAIAEVLACFVAVTVKLVLERRFGGPLDVQFALERWFRAPLDVKSALERRLTRKLIENRSREAPWEIKIEAKSVPGTSRDTTWRPGASR